MFFINTPFNLMNILSYMWFWICQFWIRHSYKTIKLATFNRVINSIHANTSVTTTSNTYVNYNAAKIYTLFQISPPRYINFQIHEVVISGNPVKMCTTDMRENTVVWSKTTYLLEDLCKLAIAPDVKNPQPCIKISSLDYILFLELQRYVDNTNY